MKAAAVIIGISGHVVSIDTATGTELWRTHLKGSDIVTTRLDGDRVYAGTKGELFCVDAQGGTVIWRNALKGLGWGLIAFGTEGEVAGAEKILQQRRAAAAAAAGS